MHVLGGHVPKYQGFPRAPDMNMQSWKACCFSCILMQLKSYVAWKDGFEDVTF